MTINLLKHRLRRPREQERGYFVPDIYKKVCRACSNIQTGVPLGRKLLYLTNPTLTDTHLVGSGLFSQTDNNSKGAH